MLFAAGNSTHTFCEQNYSVTHFVAEFWNTLSSAVYVVVAVCGLQKVTIYSLEQRANVKTAWACVCLVGLGSAVFHACMTFPTQLCDEISMLLFVLVLLYGKRLAMDEVCSPCVVDAALGVLTWLSFCATAVYVQTRAYKVFVGLFVILVGCEIGSSYCVVSAATLDSKRDWQYATCCIVMGLCVWVAEPLLCGIIAQAHLLHVVWHCLSAASAYFAVCHMAHLKVIARKTRRESAAFAKTSATQSACLTK